MRDCCINPYGCLQAKVKNISLHINWRLRITITYVTLWSPSTSKVHSLLTFCAAHAQAQLVPIYSCMYCMYTCSTRVWVVWKLSRNSVLFGAAIWGLLLHYFQKKKRAQSAVHSHIVVCSSCCRCVFCLDIRFFRKKRDCVVVFWLQSANLDARVLQTVPHTANLFVNIGNMFGTDFFSVNFHF